MRTQQVINGEKQSINMNFDRKLWRNVKVFAAQRDLTITEALEHIVREHLEECTHTTEMILKLKHEMDKIQELVDKEDSKLPKSRKRTEKRTD